MVAHLRTAVFGRARPVATRVVRAVHSERRSVETGPGQDIVHVGRIAPAVECIATLGKLCGFRQIVVSVQLVKVLCDLDACSIHPRAGCWETMEGMNLWMDTMHAM